MSISESYECIHCQNFHSSNVDHLVEHGQTCLSVSRPDLFRYKFVCFACTYYTYLKSNMIRHIRSHFGDKPFKCQFCDYSSVENRSLKIHLRKKHSVTDE
uniref:RE1-silencing transcription factor n=1 Tax=Cacopsylla melanoneura TaxID=428564 RepID=A0A8D8WXV7_9HEMI